MSTPISIVPQRIAEIEQRFAPAATRPTSHRDAGAFGAAMSRATATTNTSQLSMAPLLATAIENNPMNAALVASLGGLGRGSTATGAASPLPTGHDVITTASKYLGVDYRDINVLDDMSVRDGIKSFTNWPTIPQLYVKGEFVGGCDIVREMFQEGELQQMLESKGVAYDKSRLTA